MSNVFFLSRPLYHHIRFLIDPPGPPSIIRHSTLNTSANEVSVSVQWNPPTENGGRDDLTYTVTISPLAQLSTTVLTSTSVTVTAQYNVDYTVSVVATNCAGNSTTAEYSFRIGKYYRFVHTVSTDPLRQLSCVDQPHEWSLWTSRQQITRIHSNYPVWRWVCICCYDGDM